MSQVWYVKQEDETLGPMTAGELKQLAQASQINSETPVRLGSDGDWFEARKVKGLFSAAATGSPSPPSQPSDPLVSSPDSDSQVEDSAAPLAASVNPYQAPSVLDSYQAASVVGNPAELKMTRTGLFTVYYGICSVLLGIGVGFAALIISALVDLGFLAMVGAVLVIGGAVGGSLAILVGQIFCLTVPRTSGGKGYVQAAVTLQALAMLIGLGVIVAAFFLGTSGVATPMIEIGSNLMGFVNAVLGLASFICFLLFLKNLGLFIQRNDLASRATTIMKMVVGVVVAYFVIILLAIVPAVFGLAFAFVGILLAVLMLGILLVALITFIRYANLVSYLARAIPKQP